MGSVLVCKNADSWVLESAKVMFSVIACRNADSWVLESAKVMFSVIAAGNCAVIALTSLSVMFSVIDKEIALFANEANDTWANAAMPNIF